MLNYQRVILSYPHVLGGYIPGTRLYPSLPDNIPLYPMTFLYIKRGFPITVPSPANIDPAK